MAWIHTIPPGEERGLLKTLFEAAVARAGKVWNIVRLMSLRPEQLEKSLALYQTIMRGRSDLTRAEREMVAVVVSKTNGCHY